MEFLILIAVEETEQIMRFPRILASNNHSMYRVEYQEGI